MNYKTGLLALFSLWLLIIAGSPAAAQCVGRATVNQLPRTYTGQYSNPAYGFSVVIPNGLVGRDLDNPLYQRGFTILFRDEAESIRVYADVNSLDWPSARAGADSSIDVNLTGGGKIVSHNLEIIRLDGRSASQANVEFICGDDIRNLYSSVSIVALSHDKRFYYTLQWQGRRASRRFGEQTLKSLIDSWHFTKPTS